MENSATLNTNAALQRTRKALSDRYRIHVIDRAAHILDCFGFDRQELSVREIGAKTHLHRSTAHRILIALEYNALIQQSPENGKYRLGIKLAWLANAVGQFGVASARVKSSCQERFARPPT